MAEIFISYKNERRLAAEYLASIFGAHGFSVWFDYKLVPGVNFGRSIEAELRAAKVVVVLWCSLSTGSDAVVEEADLAKDLKTILPVRIEACDLPLGFRRVEYVDLSGWDGDPRSGQLDRLIDQVESMVGRSSTMNRRSLIDARSFWEGKGRLKLANFQLGQSLDVPDEYRRLPSVNPRPKAVVEAKPSGEVLHFTYQSGQLCAEAVPLADIAARVGTPFYCYSTAAIERKYRALDDAFSGTDHLVCYALKANSNLAVLKTFAQLGAGMDVVSVGELKRALDAGVPPERIIFAGVGKTADEMAFAVNQGILGFNVESESELELLSSIAQKFRKPARIALRVNPDVDARTHAKISTGMSENKFGIPYVDAPRLMQKAQELPGIAPVGIHMHIGSQITDSQLQPFRDAFRLMRDLAVDLMRAGHKLEHLDLGGGLGIPYQLGALSMPSPSDYAAIAKEFLGDLGLRLVMEPGRFLVGNAGVLVTRVIFVKSGDGKRFTIVDAAMNDLIRPTLYEAYHEIWPVAEHLQRGERIEQDIVGPVCETGDYLALGRELPAFEAGDLVSVMTAGAYGAVMASTYNTRPLVPEVLVRGADWAIVRPRVEVEEIIALDRLPGWLAPRT